MILTREEAEWLREFLENNQSDFESPVDKDFRERFLSATKLPE